MQYSLSELAKSLNMPPSTIERWIRQGRIPVRRRGDACTFNRQAIEKWATVHNISFVPLGDREMRIKQELSDTLATALGRGGIYYGIKGDTVEGVLMACVDRMEAVKSAGLSDILNENLLAREQMVSTGIGNGVAIPHPRTPISGGGIEAQIAACFLETPVAYNAVDKKPVFVLFILVAPTSKQHLQLLSRLSFCLRENGFIDFLARMPDPETLLDTIAGFDSRLDAPG